VFALAAYRLIPALQQSYSHISKIKYNNPILEILARDLNDTNVRNIAKNTVQTLPNKDINIINLSYSYQNSNKLILKKISLTIKKNTTVGIVGLTGSGKTTLINLIMGLITPTSGSISVGKTVLDDTNTTSWQKNIGYVPQDIFLMDDTIKNNIIFSNTLTDINIDEVFYAAKLAGISSFIESLPQSYDTKVGERGVRLSGGQVQRIGIARALYRKPSVIVFDEATNALDGITEKILIETIHKISHQKTIIMIAHRLTTVKRCDSIHLIENGIISESGSYEQLISKESSFKKMVDSHG
jgi:HlyD family secretion protein